MHIVFVTGGVVSSLGKGIVASIAGGLLKARNLKVKIKKIDPYLNVDPGTLSPIEHGEVFVTQDGAETDLDLGHYERFSMSETCKTDYITAGAIYSKIITKERNGDYLGKTIQVIPHVTDEFQKAILANTEGYDVLICEIGGTVGDIEGIPILEATRLMKQTHNVLFVHVALLPYLKKAQEWKTKPIQHSVRTLLSFGIQPDLLLCRMERENPENWKQKLALLCNLKQENIFPALDAPSIYHAMLNYEKDGVANKLIELMNFTKIHNVDISHVENFVKKLDSKLPKVKIAVIGKYVTLKDAYKSLDEALLHAAIANNVHLELELISSDNIDTNTLKQFHGILIPGGFGERGIAGKIAAIKFARGNNIPFFGICLGMQLAIIEALSLILEDVNSSEFDPKCKNPVIAKMEEWAKGEELIKAKKQMGGSMRIGAYQCNLKPNSIVQKIYNQEIVFERHRHRYEVNNNYLHLFEKAGLTISGTSSELVEMIERKDCKFFVATQAHPEFQSNIKKPHALFKAFIKACVPNDT